MELITRLGDQWAVSRAVLGSAVGKLRASPRDFADRASPEEKLHLGVLLGAVAVGVVAAASFVLRKSRRITDIAEVEKVEKGLELDRAERAPEEEASACEKGASSWAAADQTARGGVGAVGRENLSAATTTTAVATPKPLVASPNTQSSPTKLSSSPSFSPSSASTPLPTVLPVGVGTPAGAVSPDDSGTPSSLAASSPTSASPNPSTGPAGSASSEDEEEEGEEGYAPLDLPDALRLCGELVASLSEFHDASMVHTYGSFVACLISMQKVFQRPDWGYAEWPDVVAVLNEHAGDSAYDEKWAALQAELSERGFPSIPIFDGDMSRDELLRVMGEMISASETVASAVSKLKKTGDAVIDAHHTFVEEQSREAYYAWRDLCNESDFKVVQSVAQFENGAAADPGSTGGDRVVVPAATLKEWKAGYLVRAMLNMMAPLTKLQEANMRKYGIGATHFHNLVSKYADDAEVSVLKAQLEQLMGLIHPTASASGSDSESDYSGSSGDDTDSGDESPGESGAETEE
jgi:hypothetical protein